MKHTGNIRKALLALPHGAQVRVARAGLEDGWADGYLVGMGPEFFAIHLLDKGIRLDGFNCMRYADVSSVDVPSPYSAFHDRVLALRGQEPAPSLPVDLSSVSALIRTAGAVYPVVTLHLESQDPHCCYIGKVLSVDDEMVSMRSIDPGGAWEDGHAAYSLSEITRVDFGSAYEEALVLHGGEG